MSKRHQNTDNNPEVTDFDAVQATSVLELPVVTLPHEFRPDVPVLAVESIGISTSGLWAEALNNHSGDIKTLIKKHAALYYSVLSPTTLNDILLKLGDVVVDSAAVFALICACWKFQNCRSFEDEDGYNLYTALSNSFDGSDHLSPSEARFGYCCDFDISNSVWKREVLKKLKQIYVSDKLADFLYTICGHFIQLDKGENGHDRLLSYIPLDLMRTGDSGDVTTFDKFKSVLDNYVSEIDAAYNAYPFMDELVKSLGLYQPGEKYQFTRDLAQSKLKMLSDTDGVMADMAYMLATLPEPNNITDESEYLMYRIVTTKAADGSYFTFYKDDKAAADTFRYKDRIQVGIHSYVNALRGNVWPLNISVVRKRLTTGAKSEVALNPFLLTNGFSLNNDTGTAMVNTNMINGEVDMPTDATHLVVNSVTSDEFIQTSTPSPAPTSGDFVISDQDIESVISDAAYGLVCKGDYTPAADTNTLGNNGVNN